MLARVDLGLLERYATLRAEHESVVAELAAMPRDFEDKAQAAMRAFGLKASSELRQLEDALGLSQPARQRIGKQLQAAPEKDALAALQAAREKLAGADGGEASG